MNLKVTFFKPLVPDGEGDDAAREKLDDAFAALSDASYKLNERNLTESISMLEAAVNELKAIQLGEVFI